MSCLLAVPTFLTLSRRVMESAMSIVGRDQQSNANASQVNSIFFVIYNLLGAITVLTLFVSIILENASRRSGAAFLTAEQREWLDMKKLLIQQRPSARPAQRVPGSWQNWCYNVATTKHGGWNAALTTLYIAHIGILLSYTDAQPDWADTLRGTRSDSASPAVSANPTPRWSLSTALPHLCYRRRYPIGRFGLG